MSTRQRTALARQRAHGDALRQWLHDQRIAAGKRLAKARKAAAAAGGSRGVDRVPARYQDTPRPVEYLVQHTDPAYATRRAWARANGRALPAGSNTPHTNPARDHKPGARLRGELRKET